MRIQKQHGGQSIMKIASKLPAKLESYQANAGKKQPILYKGAIILIDSDKPTQLDMNLVSHQGKHQLIRAIKDGDIKKVDAAPVVAAKVEGK